MPQQNPRHRGFTLIELLLVVAIIGLIASIAAYAQHSTQMKRRDTKRVSDANEIQKALALYNAQIQGYPAFVGCIVGTDVVSTELASKGLVSAGTKFMDPLNPTNTSSCYYYTGTASAYTLRYTLEQTSTAGTVGDHLIVP